MHQLEQAATGGHVVLDTCLDVWKRVEMVGWIEH